MDASVFDTTRLGSALTIIALLVILTGCTNQVGILIPHGRFDLPETNGHSHWNIHGGVASHDTEFIFTRDIDDFPVNTVTPEAGEEQGRFFLGGSYGFSDRFDVSIKSDEIDKISAKWMLVGEPEVRSKKGDISLAISAGVGTGTSFGDNSIFEEDNDIEVSMNYKDAGLISGYRFSDGVLLYAGVFTEMYDYEFKVPAKTINQNRTHYSGDVKSQGLNAGVHFDLSEQWKMTIEALRTNVESNSTKVNETIFGLRILYFK